MPAKQATINTIDAIWALVQCQPKTVQRALIKRFVILDAEQRAMRRANIITPEMQTRLEASRKDINEGRGKECRTKAELISFLAAL